MIFPQNRQQPSKDEEHHVNAVHRMDMKVFCTGFDIVEKRVSGDVIARLLPRLKPVSAARPLRYDGGSSKSKPSLIAVKLLIATKVCKVQHDWNGGRESNVLCMSYWNT